ncbi:MAG: hypothetical protein KJ659_00955 [Actinobacteria bacterium]|nr:hypothetical protein [Actinomycetota bacterium]MBU1608928.1 hypothetical protein [Actinomycetota bacterium]MBU2316369.1 hypothetical protein [Actinomycetota bacterium]MBU2384059.1 hypothetical protein [Actinomycetota bacterium]
MDHNAEGTWQETPSGELFTLHYLDLGLNHADCSEKPSELHVSLEVKETRSGTEVTIGTPGIRVDADSSLLTLEGIAKFVQEIFYLRETAIEELMDSAAEQIEKPS